MEWYVCRLCCAVLCRALRCRAVLCCAVLCCVPQCVSPAGQASLQQLHTQLIVEVTKAQQLIPHALQTTARHSAVQRSTAQTTHTYQHMAASTSR